MSKCDIIMPVWNQSASTKSCLESIIKNTIFPYTITIVDNASDVSTKRYLENFKSNNKEKEIALIKNEKNLGFVKAVNEGIRRSGNDYICIINNDVIVTEGWLAELIKILESDTKVGIVNPSSNNLGQKVPRGKTIEEYAKEFSKSFGEYVELAACLGFCMVFRRALIKEIGNFNEIYGMGNFEDTDFSMRAKEKGYLCVRALGTYVYHKENTSFNVFKNYRREFKRNKRIFESKWGRQKRILFIATKDSVDILKINRELKSNSFVYIALKKPFKLNSSHPGLMAYYFKRMFSLNVLLKILFKKKKFDDIYCDNKTLFDILKILRPIHKANLIF